MYAITFADLLDQIVSNFEFTQAGTGAATVSQQTKSRRWLDTADYTAPQSGVTYLSGAGGGNYRVIRGATAIGATSLTHTGATSFQLAGEGRASNLTWAGASEIGLTVGSTGSNQDADISLRDFKMTGAVGTSHGIKLNRMQTVLAENLYITAAGGDGINADRSYAATYRDIISIANTGSGCVLAVPVSTNGNDNVKFQGGHYLANGAKGVWSKGEMSGGVFQGVDFEGNAVGLQIDGGSVLANTECLLVQGCYFENQTGHNANFGTDGGTFGIRNLNLIGNVFNPGTVSASANQVALDNVVGGNISGNHFSSTNLTATSSTSKLHFGYNKFSNSVGLWNPSGNPATYLEPIDWIKSGALEDLCYGVKAIGFTGGARFGITYNGAIASNSMNLLLTARTTGTQDDTGQGSGYVQYGDTFACMGICAAGGSPVEGITFDLDGAHIAVSGGKLGFFGGTSVVKQSLPAALAGGATLPQVVTFCNALRTALIATTLVA